MYERNNNTHTRGNECEERYDKENQTYKWEWEDLLEEIKI